jgi:hypothetical protein
MSYSFVVVVVGPLNFTVEMSMVSGLSFSVSVCQMLHEKQSVWLLLEL